MPLGDAEHAFAQAALADGLVLTPFRAERLNNSGHFCLPPEASRQVSALSEMCLLLNGCEEELNTRPFRPLPLDLLHAPTRTPIEIDEIQHFTTERLLSLERYPADCPLGFSLADYIELCQTHRLRADRYRHAKPARGFQRAGGRRAQRAYFDALRDLGLPALGYAPVVRIPVLDKDGAAAYRRVREWLRARLS